MKIIIYIYIYIYILSVIYVKKISQLLSSRPPVRAWTKPWGFLALALTYSCNYSSVFLYVMHFIIVNKKFRINVYIPYVYEFNDFSMFKSVKTNVTVKTHTKSLKIHGNDEIVKFNCYCAGFIKCVSYIPHWGNPKFCFYIKMNENIFNNHTSTVLCL